MEERALAALKRLKLSHIAEVRALSCPPAGCRLAMEVVCKMFGAKPVVRADPYLPRGHIDDWWPASQKLMSDGIRFLDRMLDYSMENIPEYIVNQVAPMLETPELDPAC